MLSRKIAVLSVAAAAGCAGTVQVPQKLEPARNESLSMIVPAAGPHWESLDGSKIAGMVKERADAPVPGAIPWLLLGAKSVGSDGAFSKVTSIQRVATKGGVAPAGDCSQAGARARVPYTADYYFFTAK